MRNWQKMQKILAASALIIGLSLFVGCGEDETPAPKITPQTPTVGAMSAAQGKIYIAIIPKGTQHPFWQTVYRGASDAAAKEHVNITYEGLPLGAEWKVQADMIGAAIAQKAAAICVAAFGPDYLDQQLINAQKAGIPVIAFDSPVPNAPANTITCTLATDNTRAGAIAAEKIFATESITAKLKTATIESPLIFGVAQDTTSDITNRRADGCVAKLTELASVVYPNGVAISRDGKIISSAAGGARVVIKIEISADSSYKNLERTARILLENPGIAGIFCTTEGAAMGVLSATTDGTELDREKGKYNDIVVVGFESGSTQKNAIRKKYFYGALTQDPFRIGYLTVEMAAAAAKKAKIPPQVDTGVRFYSAENIDSPEIAGLLYD